MGGFTAKSTSPATFGSGVYARFVQRSSQATSARAFAVSVPYLHLCGRVLGGALMARSAAIAARQLAEGSADAPFYRAKLQTARFYAEHLLPQSLGLLRIIKSGGASVAEADPELL